MAAPCLTANNMAEPPRLLRRPLPPKVLPALTRQIPKLIKRDESILDPRPPTPSVNRLNSDEVHVHCDNPNSHGQLEKLPHNDQTYNEVSLKHTGPEDFPPRKLLRKPSGTVLPFDVSPYQPAPPQFTLGDIIAQSSDNTKPAVELLNKPVLSQQHYTDTELLIAKLQNRNQSKVHNVLLSGTDIPEATRRIPHQQLVLERQQQEMRKREEDNSNFTGQDHNKVLSAYCDLALLESLIHGGTALSLKAFFISKLPDLMPLCDTLAYLNLSFNELRFFPTEIFKLENLEVLKLRNNPIKEIPFGIHNLKKLRTFVMSFCFLSSLPPGLFLLKNLRTLDVSYNGISSIPKEICFLRMLEFLNLEGNGIPALPCEALKLKLKNLRVLNNAMHPLFWRENSCIEPQRLTDLAALSFTKNNMQKWVKDIPKDAKQILDSCNVCDCCAGPLYGQGLLFIRPCEKIFGIRKLPFFFQACSPPCYKNFMGQTESLTEHLYGK
ncbi:leucine-rich repeat-containing protein 63 [Discoglossus pictus]